MSSGYVLDNIIINPGKAEDLIINTHAYKGPLIAFLHCLFANGK